MHVGKRFPQMGRPDLSLDGFPANAPPRKWRINSHSGSTIPPAALVGRSFGSPGISFLSPGTLGDQWLEVDVLSDVGEQLPGDDYISWRITCPNNGNSQILIEWHCINAEIPPGTFLGTRPRVRCEMTLSGTTYGDHEFIVVNSPVFTSPSLFCQSWDDWQNLTDPDIFTGIPFLKLFAGSWPDQPDYHPYRYLSL